MTTKFVIIVRVRDQDIKVMINIATRYSLEYTISSGQIYLFIADDDTLVNVANDIHAELIE